MTTSNLEHYRVPEWAKNELGAQEARDIARAALTHAKAEGLTFAQAVELAEQQLDAAAEARAMQDIERRACYYGCGIEA